MRSQGGCSVDFPASALAPAPPVSSSPPPPLSLVTHAPSPSPDPPPLIPLAQLSAPLTPTEAENVRKSLGVIIEVKKNFSKHGRGAAAANLYRRSLLRTLRRGRRLTAEAVGGSNLTIDPLGKAAGKVTFLALRINLPTFFSLSASSLWRHLSCADALNT